MTPGNFERGKAVRLTRQSSQTPTTLSGGTSVTERLKGITTRAKGEPVATFNKETAKHDL